LAAPLTSWSNAIDWDIEIVGVRMLRVRDLFRHLRGCRFEIDLVV